LSPVYVAAVVVVVIASFFNLSYTSGLTYNFTKEWRACQQTSSHVSEDTSFIFLHPLVLSSQQDVAQCAHATANFQLFLRTGTAQLGCGRLL
jgi:hypothetical protein